MHVLMVTETYPPEVNGVALTVQCLRQQLLAAGHRVSLVRPRQACDHAPAPDEVHVRSLPIPRYPGLRFGLPAGRLLRRMLRTERVDAVYVATEGPLGWSAVRAAKACCVPVASGFHTRFDDYFRHYGAPFLERAAFAWMRRFHNRADTTLVPTTELRDWLLARGFARVQLLRRAVDTQRFHPQHRDPELRRRLGVSECTPLVLHVGRLAPEKNLDLVVAGFERIRALNPAARMLWVGDGPARAQLEREHPKHLFAGVLRGAELARHYASADMFLFPSVSETFGNVTLEALASGLTVCAFDYAAAREHIVDGVSGALAPFDQSGAFIRRVEQAARDWLRGVRLGRAGRASVEQLSPQRVAEDFAQLLGALRPHAAVRSTENRHAAFDPPLL
ncbi:MAG: glycosyltransferase family 1 protein [Rhodanobacteraceae bacterium]|nr:glycosyltransferase family 1 protein [Rhodanobacteraceae bacterium]